MSANETWKRRARPVLLIKCTFDFRNKTLFFVLRQNPLTVFMCFFGCFIAAQRHLNRFLLVAILDSSDKVALHIIYRFSFLPLLLESPKNIEGGGSLNRIRDATTIPRSLRPSIGRQIYLVSSKCGHISSSCVCRYRKGKSSIGTWYDS